MTLGYQPIENIVRKGENAGNHKFLTTILTRAINKELYPHQLLPKKLLSE